VVDRNSSEMAEVGYFRFEFFRSVGQAVQCADALRNWESAFGSAAAGADAIDNGLASSYTVSSFGRTLLFYVPADSTVPVHPEASNLPKASNRNISRALNAAATATP
jgi:hypothetical protein